MARRRRIAIESLSVRVRAQESEDEKAAATGVLPESSLSPILHQRWGAVCGRLAAHFF